MNILKRKFHSLQLPVIEPYLRNTDPEIGHAVWEAMVVLSDPPAASLIRNEAMSLPPSEEALKYAKTAVHVELPAANIKTNDGENSCC